MKNPRTPAAVKRGVRSTPLTGLTSLDELAGYEDKVLDVGKIVGIDPLEKLLSRPQKREFKKKFRDVGGHWCCAPRSEKENGAPHSHGFRLMTA